MHVMWFDSNAQEMTTAEHCMYLTKFCMLVVKLWRIFIIIKLQRLKSTRAEACIIQILQELELGPALLKIKRTGGVSNWIINTVIANGYTELNLNNSLVLSRNEFTFDMEAS